MSENDDSVPGMNPTLVPPGPPSANRVMLSLYKLAEEAADLGLMSSHAAIRHAIDICAAEARRAPTGCGNNRLN